MSSDTSPSVPNPPATDAKKETPPPPKPAPARRGTRGRLIAIAALAAVIAGGYLYWKLQQQATRPPIVAQYEAPDVGVVDTVPTTPDAAPTDTPSWPAAEVEPAAPADEPQRDLASEIADADIEAPLDLAPPDTPTASPVMPAPAAVPVEIERRIAALESRVATLATVPSTGDAQALALNAAGELVALAEQRLLLARDTSGALAALRLAVSRLASGEYPVQRRALLADLAALEAFRDVDVAALAAELADLARDAPALRLAAPAPLAPVAPPAPVEGWRSLFAAIWASLRELVEVRDADETRDPLLNPAHAALARQQLALDLSAARVAVLQRDATAFRAALTPAIDELAGRFDAADPAVANALMRLRAMREVDLAPALPGLARSVDALAAAPAAAAPQAALPASPPPLPPAMPDAPAAETAL
ncbi:MAG: uroporphyrinogen-III C-methyltransferase [Gammaproteobacteria bacterium]